MTWFAQYKFNEASSGTVPTQALDTGAATVVPLNINYHGGNWTSIAAGDGLYKGACSVLNTGTGNKLYDEWQGTNTATLEIVITPGTIPDGFMFASRITNESNGGTMSIIINLDGTIQCMYQHNGPGTYQLTSSAGAITISNTNVLHLVYDVLNGTSTDRARLYLNGSRITPVIYEIPTGTLDIATSGNANFTFNDADDTWDGTMFWIALADHAANDAEVSSRATNLLLDNDVDPATLPGPTITLQPQSQTVFVGQTAAFTVSATGTGTLHYQWKKDGVNVGTDSSSYTTPSTDMSYNGAIYTVDITDDNDTTPSDEARLNVIFVTTLAWFIC